MKFNTHTWSEATADGRCVQGIQGDFQMGSENMKEKMMTHVMWFKQSQLHDISECTLKHYHVKQAFESLLKSKSYAQTSTLSE